jgi:hypothetical protein
VLSSSSVKVLVWHADFFGRRIARDSPNRIVCGIAHATMSFGWQHFDRRGVTRYTQLDHTKTQRYNRPPLAEGKGSFYKNDNRQTWIRRAALEAELRPYHFVILL